VENALLAHDAISEAAVVGRSFDGLTKPVAYVVARAKQASDAQFVANLREFLHGRLAGHKVPVEFHLVRELPKTATGKIQRYKLR
jgi:acyl-coenzyme A synthetase/AMP-(fatty) acid ligase